MQFAMELNGTFSKGGSPPRSLESIDEKRPSRTIYYTPQPINKKKAESLNTIILPLIGDARHKTESVNSLTSLNNIDEPRKPKVFSSVQSLPYLDEGNNKKKVIKSKDLY